MRILLSVVTALSLSTTALVAHEDVANQAVRERMVLMSEIADNTKTLGTMVKGELPFDAEAAKAALVKISELSAKSPAAFEAQEMDPKSEAKPILWEEFDKFTALANTLSQDTAAAAQSLSTMDDLKVAMGKTGGGCKACHSQYRE